MLYTLRVHGRNAFNVHETPVGLIAWSWITVVVTAVVVGVTDVMFLVYLPSWIRHGLPPVYIGQPEECHMMVEKEKEGTAEVALIEIQKKKRWRHGAAGGGEEHVPRNSKKNEYCGTVHVQL